MKQFFFLATTLFLFAGCNPSNQPTTKNSESAASSTTVSSPASEPPVKTEKKNKLDQIVLRVTAEQLNRSAPKSVDEETTLTKVDVREDGLLYNFELVNKVATDFDSDATAIIRGVVKERVCTNPDTKAYLKQGYSYYYSYVGKDKKPIAKFSIAPADCGV